MFLAVNKMAAVALIVCLATTSMIHSWSNAADVQVSISTPIDTVVVGGILAIQCQVWNIPENSVVNIFRSSNGKTYQVVNEEEIVRSSERLHMFLAKRTFTDGSLIYFLTIVGASNEDEGEYVCKIVDFAQSSFIAEESVNVQIFSYPANMYPICASTPNQPNTLRVHDTLILKCTSEKGVPSVQMKWISNKSSRDILTQTIIEDNLQHAEAFVTVDKTLQGAVFMCEISSTAFPDWKRTCVVGPITVKAPRLEGVRGLTTSKTLSKNTEIKNAGDTEINYLDGMCSGCSSNDMLSLYLTAATIGASLFTVIFMTSTIILCYKYHNISEAARRRPASIVATSQPVEPVYVSLQRRLTPEQREYMTLEDPNNPDNKIILPKETFDDYCRTMTLKRV